MLKAYLKKICGLEQEILERKSKLETAKKEFERSKNDIEKKKKALQASVKETKNELQKFIDLKKSKEKYQPEGVLHIILLFVITIVVTVLITFLVKYILIGLFGATSAITALPAYLVIYLIPVVLLWIFFSLGDGISLGPTLGFISLYALVNFLTWGYYRLFEIKGHSLTYALMFFMGILLAIEIIICTICCVKEDKRQKRKYYNNKRWLRNCKKEQDELITKCNEAQKKVDDYSSSSQRAITLMSDDIRTQTVLLKKAEDSLKSLYEQNTLHSKYQHWVAAATIYEYLDVGRCYELKGPDGAYNLYEKELFEKKILSSLNAINISINRQGDRIMDSQSYIRSQLNACNYKLSNYKFNTYGY